MGRRVMSEKGSKKGAGDVSFTVVSKVGEEPASAPRRFDLSSKGTEKIRIGRNPKAELLFAGNQGISWSHLELKLAKPSSAQEQVRLLAHDLSSNGTGLRPKGGEVEKLKKGVDTPVPDAAVLTLPLDKKDSGPDWTRVELTIEICASSGGKSSSASSVSRKRKRSVQGKKSKKHDGGKSRSKDRDDRKAKAKSDKHTDSKDKGRRKDRSRSKDKSKHKEKARDEKKKTRQKDSRESEKKKHKSSKDKEKTKAKGKRDHSKDKEKEKEKERGKDKDKKQDKEKERIRREGEAFEAVERQLKRLKEDQTEGL